MQFQLSEERNAQLSDYAKRHGQDPETALDGILADALTWELQDYRDATEAIREGYADAEAGRTQTAAELMKELQKKHAVPS